MSGRRYVGPRDGSARRDQGMDGMCVRGGPHIVDTHCTTRREKEGMKEATHARGTRPRSHTPLPHTAPTHPAPTPRSHTHRSHTRTPLPLIYTSAARVTRMALTQLPPLDPPLTLPRARGWHSRTRRPRGVRERVWGGAVVRCTLCLLLVVVYRHRHRYRDRYRYRYRTGGGGGGGAGTTGRAGGVPQPL